MCLNHNPVIVSIYIFIYYSLKATIIIETDNKYISIIQIYFIFHYHWYLFLVNALPNDTLQLSTHLGAYLGKGTYWQFFHKLDSRETSLLNAANHFKIFLIEFDIWLYEHLYFLYIREPLFLIVAFISMFWQLKVNMFYPKSSFPIV